MTAPDRRRFLGGLVGLATLPWASGCQRPAPITEAGFMVFGQTWTLRFHDTPAKQVNAATRAAEAIVEPLYRRLHPWKESELTRLNQQLAERGEARAGRDIRELIRIARPIHSASDGRFDPSIGRLIALWGFHAAPRGKSSQASPPPTEAALENWLAHAPSMDDVHLEGDLVVVSNRRVQFDFNALAEGFAAGRVLDAIGKLGVTDCLLDSGGDIYTLGSVGARQWRLGIRDPRGEGVLGGVSTRGRRALCSSGDYQRRIQYRGESFGHIIDPLTARPTRANTGTTVLDDNPALADGAATALMLATPEQAAGMARQLGLDGTLIVTQNGQTWRDPGMAGAMGDSPPGDWRAL